ncbi:hypothetical protein [Mesobacillus foraminis]|uniref:Uncharacterized protein n=1 Tax=Mesobacillus foraminis TaxID=279826 RepID=A0A4R2AXC9_9BACI|nr:hypothetical protein [Mesobacillus foraminis]TCN18443.1 hypothetical protein EV146_12042 [Mesobacillus foraminis]
MRNDVIERTANDTMLTIADYLLQMIEQARKQRDLELRSLIDQDSKNMQRDYPHLSAEERAEGEYELYYALLRERHSDVFEVQGNLQGTFPVDGNSRFQIHHDKNEFYGVYNYDGKKPHRITDNFLTKEDLISNLFGSTKFEIFRNRTFFHCDDGKVYSLHDNKHFRLHMIKDFKFQLPCENIEHARLSVVKDELRNDGNLRLQALKKTLDEYGIPSDLVGETVTLSSVSSEKNGVRVLLEHKHKERQIMVPEMKEQWLERVRDYPKLKAAFDEFIMDSRSIGEGFLAFYGIELNKGIQTKQHGFEVMVNQEGSYIGKLHGSGKVKKVSPYFSSEKEAEVQLGKLENHIQLAKEQERQKENLNREPVLEVNETVEKN